MLLIWSFDFQVEVFMKNFLANQTDDCNIFVRKRGSSKRDSKSEIFNVDLSNQFLLLDILLGLLIRFIQLITFYYISVQKVFM